MQACSSWLKLQFHNPSSKTCAWPRGSLTETSIPWPQFPGGPGAVWSWHKAQISWLRYWSPVPCSKTHVWPKGSLTQLLKQYPLFQDCKSDPRAAYNLWFVLWLMTHGSDKPRSQIQKESLFLPDWFVCLICTEIESACINYLAGRSFLKIVGCKVLLIKICFTVWGTVCLKSSFISASLPYTYWDVRTFWTYCIRCWLHKSTILA